MKRWKVGKAELWRWRRQAPIIAADPDEVAPGKTPSRTFFFATAFGAQGSPSRPSNVSRSPTAASAGGSTNSTRRSPSTCFSAQSTMPWDLMSPIFLAFRLQNTRMRRSCICSSE
eukprot:scaffold923_cov256-Pinguiococcus_pyrenoidosus.AAC.41